MKQDNIKDTARSTHKQYIQSCKDIVMQFCKTYFDGRIEAWNDGDIHGVYRFNDHFFSFFDIKFAVDNKITADHLFEWYDVSLEEYEKTNNSISLIDFLNNKYETE